MTQPLRIAILTPNMTLGGAERWVISLARHFDPRTAVVPGIIVGGWGGLDAAMSREIRAVTTLHSHTPGVRPAHARPYDPEGAVMHETLTAAIAHVCQDADVLLSWGDPGLGYVIPENFPLPVVLVSHTTTTSDKQRPMHPRITHCAAVSQAAASYFEGRPDMGDRQIQIVYNGAEGHRLHPVRTRAEMRREWGWSDTDVVIGYVGRYCREKNPGAAMTALAALPPEFKAVYHGDDGIPPHTVAAELRETAAGLGGRAHVCETVNQIGNVFHAIDVLMLASHREAFSLTLLEAWLCGVPVIATPVGSIPELEASHGQLVIPVGHGASPAQLAAAVRAATGKLGQGLAHKTRALAWSNFTAEHMAANWVTYLRTLVR